MYTRMDMSRAAARKPRSPRSAPRSLSIAEARAHLPDVIRRAESGEEIQITRRGVPVALVRPIADDETRRADRFRALLRDLAARPIPADAGPEDPWADVRDLDPGRPPPTFD